MTDSIATSYIRDNLFSYLTELGEEKGVQFRQLCQGKHCPVNQLINSKIVFTFPGFDKMLKVVTGMKKPVVRSARNHEEFYRRADEFCNSLVTLTKLEGPKGSRLGSILPVTERPDLCWSAWVVGAYSHAMDEINNMDKYGMKADGSSKFFAAVRRNGELTMDDERQVYMKQVPLCAEPFIGTSQFQKGMSELVTSPALRANPYDEPVRVTTWNEAREIMYSGHFTVDQTMKRVIRNTDHCRVEEAMGYNHGFRPMSGSYDYDRFYDTSSIAAAIARDEDQQMVVIDASGNISIRTKAEAVRDIVGVKPYEAEKDKKLTKKPKRKVRTILLPY